MAQVLLPTINNDPSLRQSYSNNKTNNVNTWIATNVKEVKRRGSFVLFLTTQRLLRMVIYSFLMEQISKTKSQNTEFPLNVSKPIYSNYHQCAITNCLIEVIP